VKRSVEPGIKWYPPNERCENRSLRAFGARGFGAVMVPDAHTVPFARSVGSKNCSTMKFFQFGEQIPGYDFRVINEREARASAGIMFLLGLMSLFSVYQLRTIFWAELFSLTFIIEFLVRVLIRPAYAPYMLLGALIVHNQAPDWVEARPKHFAWALGLGLGAVMTVYIVFDIISPVRLAICWLCLFLMYVESVFGICLGCMLYKYIHRKTYLCPGGVCETTPKRNFSRHKWLVLAAFLVLFSLTYTTLKHWKFPARPRVEVVK